MQVVTHMKTTINALLIENSLSDAQCLQDLLATCESLVLTLQHIEAFQHALHGEALQLSSFDVVLLGLNVINEEGLAQIKQLKDLAPAITVIVLTSSQAQEAAIATLQAGAQDCVVKSDVLSPERLQCLGHHAIGQMLAKILRYAIQRTEQSQRLECSN